MTAFPFHCVLDDIRLSYSERQGQYRFRYRKMIRNDSNEPLCRYYARLKTCAFPNAPSLAKTLAQRHPLDLGVMGFEASSDNKPIEWRVTGQSDADIELCLQFADPTTHRASPIQPGDTRSLDYRFTVRHDQWGPFLQYRTQCPVDVLRVELQFPRRLVKVHGSREGLAFGNTSISKQIDRKKRGRSDFFCYAVHQPTPCTQYGFTWAFPQRTQEAIKTQASRFVDDSEYIHVERQAQVCFSTDFRSGTWKGDYYVFSSSQAKVVELLWRNWFNGTPVVGWQALARHAGVRAQKFHDLFGGHPAAGTLIVNGGQMAWRLHPKAPGEPDLSP